MEASESVLRVCNLAGDVVLEISLCQVRQSECSEASLPMTVRELKCELAAKVGVPQGLQRILLDGEVLSNSAPLGTEALTVTLVVDETPLSSWDIAGNPGRRWLSGGGGLVKFLEAPEDYVNVITEEPVRRGAHYFEFKMIKIGDEQWCGVTAHQSRAGCDGEDTRGWYYYCGRRHSVEGSLHAGQERRTTQTFKHVKDGDSIGILLDVDDGRLAFVLNSELQGACRIDDGPMYLTTCLDREGDCVELRKLPLDESPISLEDLRALELPEVVDKSAWWVH
eukprot:TRINITY_DN37675_c0_g1_i1.p1 TRINITY_DN37675_c0_g1~~TRINITY_DN37675_c0_g1_i1.p1  ORF type:complete len:280 (-),score=45.03 TRINITY_DN37675_c0_g1_i1:221-1060(-)